MFGTFIIGEVALPEEYLKGYKWFKVKPYIAPFPVAMVSHRGCDIWLTVWNSMPFALDPKNNPELYHSYTPATKDILKYAKLWSKAGFYRSMHIKEFLDQIMENKE